MVQLDLDHNAAELIVDLYSKFNFNYLGIRRMKQYVGNCGDVIDWNAVVEKRKFKPIPMILTHKERRSIRHTKEIREAWDKAGYTLVTQKVAR